MGIHKKRARQRQDRVDDVLLKSVEKIVRLKVKCRENAMRG